MVYLSQFWTALMNGAKGFLSQLNWVDIVILILLARASYIGIRKGLFIEITKVLGVVSGLFVATMQHSRLGQKLSERLNLDPVVANNVAFWALLLAVYLGARLVGFVLEKVLKVETRGFWSRFWGAGLGLSRGAIVVACLSIGILFTGSSYLTQSIEEKSLLAPFFVKGGAAIYRSLHQFSASFTIEGFDRLISTEPKISK